MKRFVSVFLLLLICLFTVAQNVTLTFTGRDDHNRHVQLDHIVVTDQTHGWQKSLFWPDTTLTLWQGTDKGRTTIETYHDRSLKLAQNNPNPFNGTTDVVLVVADAGTVTIEITDINGRAMTAPICTSLLPCGTHQYHITLSAAGTYLLTARQNGKTASIKMVNNGGGNGNMIEYAGFVETFHETSLQMQQYSNQIIMYNPGDQMEFVGYAIIDNKMVESQHILQIPEYSQTFTMLFAGETNQMYANGAGNGGTNFIDTDENEDKESTDKSKKSSVTKQTEPFRVALSLSPFSLNQFQQGYTFSVGDRTASTPEELQQIYRDLGSTEMYVRIATKRHVTAENTVDGVEDENANVHTFDQGIHLCEIAAALDIPINPEIMCAYTYMDMDKQQAPRFEEYPEIYALQNGKKWSELTLDEICTVLEAYGAFVGEAILRTGCTVNNWNLGNEANFGFAGISMGLETAVNPKLKKAGNLKKYTAPVFARGWLKRNVWKYDAPAYAAVKRGILSAYTKLGISDSSVKFSTHIATVVFPPVCSVKFFNYMKEKGYEMETAGISYYPSAPSMSANKKRLLRKTVTKINQKCGLPVFIGEFSYPSGKMEGPFAGWNKKVRGYKKNQQGQADIYADVMKWGKNNGLVGIRYWAPDYEGWYAMSMFEFSNKKGTAKMILKNHKEIIEK